MPKKRGPPQTNALTICSWSRSSVSNRGGLSPGTCWKRCSTQPGCFARVWSASCRADWSQNRAISSGAHLYSPSWPGLGSHLREWREYPLRTPPAHSVRDGHSSGPPWCASTAPGLAGSVLTPLEQQSPRGPLLRRSTWDIPTGPVLEEPQPLVQARHPAVLMPEQRHAPIRRMTYVLFVQRVPDDLLEEVPPLWGHV